MESEQRLHELLVELVRVITAWHVDPGEVGAGLSLSQIMALHALDVDPPPSQQDLVSRLRLEKSSVSRLVADLERRGLVTRERDADNRRLYQLRITAAGRAAHADLRSTFHQHYQRLSALLTGRERTALVTGLAAFLRAANQLDQARPAGTDAR
jgi:DNA-binding MarR family transcriptional regulator